MKCFPPGSQGRYRREVEWRAEASAGVGGGREYGRPGEAGYPKSVQGEARKMGFMDPHERNGIVQM